MHVERKMGGEQPLSPVFNPWKGNWKERLWYHHFFQPPNQLLSIWSFLSGMKELSFPNCKEGLQWPHCLDPTPMLHCLFSDRMSYCESSFRRKKRKAFPQTWNWQTHSLCLATHSPPEIWGRECCSDSWQIFNQFLRWLVSRDYSGFLHSEEFNG